MEHLEISKDIFLKYLSRTHPNTIDILNSISTLKMTLKYDPTILLEEFYELLELFLDVYGETDPSISTIYNNIGLCYYYLHENLEAINNFKNAIKINQSCTQVNQSDIAYMYNNIGATYAQMENPKLAIYEHLVALDILKKEYPNQLNIDLARTYVDLSEMYLELGDIDKTSENLNSAFKIFNSILPRDSMQYLQPYNILADLLYSIKSYPESMEQYQYLVWLMLENGYTENSDSVMLFKNRIIEINNKLESEAEDI